MASKTDYEDNAKLAAAKKRRMANADKKMLREGFHGRAADLAEARSMAKAVLKPYKEATSKTEDVETANQLGKIAKDRRIRNEFALVEGSGYAGQDPKYMPEQAHGYTPKAKKVTRKPDYVSETYYAKGGPVAKKGSAVIKEKGTGEVYKSKKAMLVHERGETPAEERKQHGLKKGAKLPAAYKKAKGMMSGGKVSSGNVKVPNVVKAGSAKLK